MYLNVLYLLNFLLNNFFEKLCLHSRDVTKRDCLVLNVSGRSCFQIITSPASVCQLPTPAWGPVCIYISIRVIAVAVHFQFDSNVWYGLNKLLRTWCCYVLHVVNTTKGQGPYVRRGQFAWRVRAILRTLYLHVHAFYIKETNSIIWLKQRLFDNKHQKY